MVKQSLPQLAYSGTAVLEHEASVANSQHIAMFDLMKSAGQAVFDYIERAYGQRSLLIVAGKGNNGGDGFIVGQLALASGIAVQLILLGEFSQLSGDAKQAAQLFINAGGKINEFTNDSLLTDLENPVVVDAIFGIGFKGQLPTGIAQVIASIHALEYPIVSVDTPSGVNATTGEVSQGAVQASATVSFIALKQGLLTGQAQNHVGNLVFAPLSLAQAFCQQVDSRCFIQRACNLSSLVPRLSHQHKGHLGKLVTVGGQKGMPGAIRLASEAALRSGAPLVSVVTAPENHSIVIANRYELMLGATDKTSLKQSQLLLNAKCVVIGPGLGQSPWANELFDYVMTTKTNLIIDADALYLLAKYFQQHNQVENYNPWILTPHPKEAAALLNCTVEQVEKNRFDAVTSIAQKYRCVCVLKGAGTLTSDGVNTWINSTGNHAMATGGMGDVLSGVIGALAMQTNELIDAARLAVYLHGKAGDNIAAKQGHIGLLASDLLLQFPVLLQSIYEPVSSDINR
ncbi:NAD(P)H-hydrate dehydratase [Thalassotalea sp. LPB0316]|uniref:NAD(P)H-hydrate dehydratase n=1 Tax=Thalassotalea sp. LPB0316 TaxID=2769490 RepID=UPI001866B330|nr:NAD(P)H-hydrate dehydratase [Thalassotalea sp. LPB0316]QOL26529.1 NAD(P)H-hydrate dehydratase [Thalassotalea sp. LPB0316]